MDKNIDGIFQIINENHYHSKKKNNNNNLLVSLNDPSPKNAQFILTISLPLPHNDEGVYNTAMI